MLDSEPQTGSGRDPDSNRPGSESYAHAPSVDPLLLPEILERLFSFFEPNHSKSPLCRLRLVCRAWNAEASRRLRRHRQIVVFGQDALAACLEGPFQIQNYKITGRNWSAPSLQDSNSTVHRFLCGGVGVGAHVRELHLTIVGWSPTDWRMFFVLLDLPNLAALRFQCPTNHDYSYAYSYTPFSIKQKRIQLRSLETLDVITGDSQKLNPTLVQLIAELIQANSGLRRLRFITQERPEIPVPSRCIPTSILRAFTSLPRLGSLHLDFYLTNTQLALFLAQMRARAFRPLGLHTLAFGVQANIDGALLRELLTLFGSLSLSTLVLCFEWMSTASGMQSLRALRLPALLQLRVLRLANVAVRFNDFLRVCPNLEALTLTNAEIGSMAALPYHRLLRLWSLELSTAAAGASADGGKASAGAGVEDMCYLCPNLRDLSLEGQLSNSAVRLIIARLPRLVRLKLAPRNVHFDEIAFGGHEIDCRDGLRNAELPEGHTDAEGGSPEDDPAAPACICELEDLRDLYIESNLALTNGIVDAIGHCQGLMRLSLKGAGLTGAWLARLVSSPVAMRLSHFVFHGSRIGHATKTWATEELLRTAERECIEILEVDNEEEDRGRRLFNSFAQSLQDRNCRLT